MEIEWDDRALRNLEKETMETVRAELQRAVSGLVCPDHHKPVRFVSERGRAGSGTEALGRVEGCCEKAVQLGQKAIDRKLR